MPAPSPVPRLARPALPTARPLLSAQRVFSRWRGLFLVGVLPLWPLGQGCSETPPPVESPQTAPLSPTVTEVLSGVAPVDPSLQWNATWVQKTAAEFAGWRRRGIQVGSGQDGLAAVQLAPSSTRLDCPSEDIDGGAAHFDEKVGLCSGQDPTGATLPAGVSYYAGTPFFFGTLISPEVKGASVLDHLIPSWHATTPPGTWIQLHVRAKLPSGWTGWYRLPIWASDAAWVKRRSVKLPADANGGVDVDTFFLKSPQVASAYQLSVTLFSMSARASPTLHMVAAAASRDAKVYPQRPPHTSVWGKNLPVPQRSQALPEYKDKGFGGGGEVWCSPTSTSMVMEYWSHLLSTPSLNHSVPDAAAGCFDWVYNGTGNWPFNTAFAASQGLFGVVTRLDSMSEAESWIAAGVPLIISISFKPGELPGAPISKTNGHLLVVRGFDESGNVIVNDPAARDNASVQRTYPRAALEAAWTHSHRTAYLIYPRSWLRLGPHAGSTPPARPPL